MRKAPIGYKIENGKAVIDEAAAAQVRMLFEAYNSGMSLKEAADKAGLEGYHSSIGRILKNTRYLGDDYYPALIDRDTFEKSQLIRYEKAKSLGRVYDYSDQNQGSPERKPVRFKLGKIPDRYKDPYEQAAFVYGLIETEEADGDECNSHSC